MADAQLRPRVRRTVAPRTVLIVASLGVAMAFIDDTIVTIAFPNMIRSFSGATLNDLAWVFNIYNVALAALLVLAGRVADLLGRRRTFAFGVLVFTIASALAAVAPSVGALIAARALQGVGGAIILPASLALILEAYPGPRRARAVAAWTATGAAAAGIGPSIGGLLVDIADWRLIFVVNLPIGIATWRLSQRQLVESRAPGQRSLPDVTGALVLAIAISAASLALIQSQPWGWTDARTVGAGVLSLAAFALFVQRCRTHPSPIVDAGLLRTRRVLVANLLTLIGGAGFFALGLVNILYLIDVWGYSPLDAGLAQTPAPFLAAVAAVLSERLVGRRDARWFVVAGALIWTAGPLILRAQFSLEPHYLTGYLSAAAVLAVGVGIASPLVGAIAVSDAPGGRFAGATALNSAIRQFGAAIGVAILVALLGRPSPSEVESAYGRGWLFAALCFALVGVGAVALGRVSLAGDAAEPEPVAPPPLGAAVPSPRPPAAVAPRTVPQATDAQDPLAGVGLFAHQTPEQRSRLTAAASVRSLAAGEWLFRQGDEADGLYIVRTGRLQVIDETPAAGPQVLRELGPGGALGEVALLRDSARTASVRARRDATLLHISRDDFEAEIAGSPAASRALLRTLSDWLAGGGAPSAAGGSPVTIAVVALDREAEAAALEHRLAAALGALPTRVEEVGAAAVPTGDAPGPALSALLDRLEPGCDHVVLAAGVLGAPDGWTDACIQQADRVLAVTATGDADTGPDALGRLLGCDLALLGAPERATALAERLRPRATHRVDAATGVAALARRLAGRSVGLVLSGGGARCLSHIGVIEELSAAGIVIDRVGGTSMGAFIGAQLAQGLDAEEIDACCYEEFVRRNPFGDYRVPRISLLRGDRARALLERTLPSTFHELELGFFCVSVDLIAAETVVHRRGALVEAVGASMSLPILAPPMAVPGRLLLDGGLMDNMPTETMARDAEGPIIAVDASEHSVRQANPEVPPPVPMLAETVYRVMLLSEPDTARRESFADLLIRPDYGDTGILEFHMLDTLRAAGRAAARSALEQAPAAVFG